MLNLLIIIFKYFPPDKQSHENLTKRFSAAAEITVCYFSFCSLGPDIHTSCSNWIGMGLKSCHNSLHLTITRCVDATWNCKRVHWRDDTVIVDIVPRTKLSVTHHHSCNHSYYCRRRNSRHLCSSVSHSNLCIRFAAAGLGTCTSRSICIGACRRVCRSSHHLHWRTKMKSLLKMSRNRSTQMNTQMRLSPSQLQPQLLFLSSQRPSPMNFLAPQSCWPGHFWTILGSRQRHFMQ